jgi:hypothetical protein
MHICNPSLLDCKRSVLLPRRGGEDRGGERPSGCGGDRSRERSKRRGGARRSSGDPPPERESSGGADGPGCRCRGRRGGAEVVRGRRPLCQASRRRASAERGGSRRTSSRLIEGSHRPSAPHKEILPSPYQLTPDPGAATAWSSRSRGDSSGQADAERERGEVRGGKGGGAPGREDLRAASTWEGAEVAGRPGRERGRRWRHRRRREREHTLEEQLDLPLCMHHSCWRSHILHHVCSCCA